MKKRQSFRQPAQSKQPEPPKVVGNYAKPPLTDKVPPAFITYPLTNYETQMLDGRQGRNIPEQNVLRLREFDIENKK